MHADMSLDSTIIAHFSLDCVCYLIGLVCFHSLVRHCLLREAMSCRNRLQRQTLHIYRGTLMRLRELVLCEAIDVTMIMWKIHY
jgi:hypothetical protein